MLFDLLDLARKALREEIITIHTDKDGRVWTKYKCLMPDGSYYYYEEVNTKSTAINKMKTATE